MDGLRLWVDDERDAPDGFQRAWTSDEAILHLLAHAASPIAEVSLDHDLGGDDTGMKVLDWMITNDVWPAELTIHTANPPARKRMLQAANAEAPAATSISWIIR
jgi:hypothetical protein